MPVRHSVITMSCQTWLPITRPVQPSLWFISLSACSCFTARASISTAWSVPYIMVSSLVWAWMVADSSIQTHCQAMASISLMPMATPPVSHGLDVPAARVTCAASSLLFQVISMAWRTTTSMWISLPAIHLPSRWMARMWFWRRQPSILGTAISRLLWRRVA